MLNVIHRGAPRMNLDNSDLHKAQQPFDTVHPKTDTLAALTLLDAQLMNVLGNDRQRTVMEEGHSVHVPDQLQGPSAEILKRLLAHLLPIGSELLLRGNDGIR